MVRNVLTGLVLLGLVLVSFAYGIESPRKKEALRAAENWLALIDQGKYAASWQQAATYFQTAVPEKKWVQSLNAVRKPLGKLISRKVKSAIYKTSLSGAPDGKYVVIRFKTSFGHKKSAIETVTPMLDKDGKWRVAGYFIK